MKKLLILLFSLLISFNSFGLQQVLIPELNLYGEWTKFYSEEEGEVFIQKDIITKKDGSVYWWTLGNLNQPDDENGMMSFTIYHQGDCNLDRTKVINVVFYEKPMGMGTSNQYLQDDEYVSSNEWEYTTPETITSDLLDYVCEHFEELQ